MTFRYHAIFYIFYIIILLPYLFTQTLAHSHLAQPLPTRELHCRVGSQRGRDCYGPCPPIDDYGRLNHPISIQHPAETWARGQTVTIRWHRNNHDGTGFVRFALVPLSHMMDKDAHERFAFHYTCANTGLHHCPNRRYDTCGNDATGTAWQTTIQIPAIYPDGIYVFGWAWFGGGDYRSLSYFGDYYSCSFIRVRGGVSVMSGDGFLPRFVGGVCVSAVGRLGVCWSEPCRIGRMREMVPDAFRNGRVPAAITTRGVLTMRNDVENDESVRRGARSNRQHGDGNGIQVLDERTLTGTQSQTRQEQQEQSGMKKVRIAFLDLKSMRRRTVRDGGVYHRADFTHGLTVEAWLEGRGGWDPSANNDGMEMKVRHVDFYVDDVLVRRELKAPFVMNGNHGRRIFAWEVPVGRMVKVSVVVAAQSGEILPVVEADVEFV